ncbi:MAG: hypothetical protein V1815_01850 [Candidatus Woesearchaeota archaeon]
MNLVKKCALYFDRKELLDSIKGFTHKGIYYPLKEYQQFNLHIQLSCNILSQINNVTDELNKHIMTTILGKGLTLQPKYLPIDPGLIALVNRDEKIEAISTTFMSRDKIPILYFKTNDLSRFENKIKQYLEEHNLLKKSA